MEPAHLRSEIQDFDVQEVNVAAWQEVGRRMCKAFAAADAEESDDEWQPCKARAQSEAEKEIADFKEVNRRLADAFAAAAAIDGAAEHDEEEPEAEVPISEVQVAALKWASPRMGLAHATQATLPSTAPGTAVPSEVEEVEGIISDSDQDASSSPRGPFRALFGLQLDEPTERATAAPRAGGAASEREDEAFNGLCRRIANVFAEAEASESEEEQDRAFNGLCGRIANVFANASASDSEEEGEW